MEALLDHLAVIMCEVEAFILNQHFLEDQFISTW